MTITQKPKIAILSIRNKYNYGGVLACLKKAYEYCERYFEPTVFFLGFDREISASIKGFKFSSSSVEYNHFGMRCVEIGARWAFWEPGHYEFTLNTWKEYLHDFNYYMIVSGTAVAGHPLQLLDKKYITWIGTPYLGDGIERRKQLTGLNKWIHFFAEPRMLEIEQKILEQSHYTLGISKYATSEFEKIGAQSSHPFESCGYPIYSSKSQHLLEKKENFLLAVGRFSDPRKNIDMLIRCFSRIYEQRSDLKLIVAGSSPDFSILKKYHHLACYDSITFTGQIPSDDLETMYAKAQLLLITSYQEGLGIVGLEALLRGTPVIATDCGGTRDYVLNGTTGYLVPINDDQKMAEHVLNLLASPILYASCAEAGRQLVAQQFSQQHLIDTLDRALITTYPELEKWIRDQERFYPAEKTYLSHGHHAEKNHTHSGC